MRVLVFILFRRNLSVPPKNLEPDKCDDLQFFPIGNLPKNMVPHVKEVIEAYRSGENYNEFNWESRS